MAREIVLIPDSALLIVEARKPIGDLAIRLAIKELILRCEALESVGIGFRDNQSYEITFSLRDSSRTMPCDQFGQLFERVGAAFIADPQDTPFQKKLSEARGYANAIRRCNHLDGYAARPDYPGWNFRRCARCSLHFYSDMIIDRLQLDDMAYEYFRVILFIFLDQTVWDRSDRELSDMARASIYKNGGDPIDR